MISIPTNLPGVVLLQPRVFEDARGFFLESYRRDSLQAHGVDVEFVQDNHSRSCRGVLRGLHFQTENTQGKLVRVTEGEVLDVVVDLRIDSDTYGETGCYRLSSENKHILYVPPGFAHGFLVLSERADFLYKCTDYYNPAAEVCLLWNDPSLSIPWPRLAVNYEISAKDLRGQTWSEIGWFENSIYRSPRVKSKPHGGARTAGISTTNTLSQ